MGEQVAAKFKRKRLKADPLPKLKINTGKDEQQLINANPISRAVLLKSWVSPVIRDLKRFRFLMTDECQSKQMRSSKTFGLIAHGITCQCLQKQTCL